MAFAKDLNTGPGCFAVVGLMIVLLLVAWRIGPVTAPKVLLAESSQEPSVLIQCLGTPKAEGLFGKMFKIPVGNPLAVHRSQRRSYFYLTSGGQQFIAYGENGLTKLVVRARSPLSRKQADFLRHCSRSSGAW